MSQIAKTEGKLDPKFLSLASEFKLTVGKLNFELNWNSPNDLDLHVFCP